MFSKKRVVASAAAALLGVTTMVTTAPVNADDEFWGAIAYSPLDGAFGTSSQQSKDSDAGNAAVVECADNGGSACQVVVTVERPNCASLVGNESLYSWGVGQDRVDAKRSAMEDLGEPGSEVAFTCGYIAGIAPAPVGPAPSLG